MLQTHYTYSTQNTYLLYRTPIQNTNAPPLRQDTPLHYGQSSHLIPSHTLHRQQRNHGIFSTHNPRIHCLHKTTYPSPKPHITTHVPQDFLIFITHTPDICQTHTLNPCQTQYTRPPVTWINAHCTDSINYVHTLHMQGSHHNTHHFYTRSSQHFAHPQARHAHTTQTPHTHRDSPRTPGISHKHTTQRPHSWAPPTDTTHTPYIPQTQPT